MNKKKNTKNMAKKSLKLNKIPITALMQILGELFEEGVDFIDIEGEGSEKEEESDRIKVTVRPEYYSEEPEIFTKLEQGDTIDNDEKLTDDDINDLI
jgi:hypothetical protein